MSDTFDALEKLFFTIQDNFDTLLAASTTDDQRTALRNAYATARDNYNVAMNKAFADNDQAVAGLRQQLQDGQQQINDSLNSLQSIATTIDAITAAVAVGTKLAALV